MDEFNEKSEFYRKIEKYHWDKTGKKTNTDEKIETIIVETNDAKLT